MRKPRPSLAPRRKLTVSPVNADSQVTARISGRETPPCWATAPPSSTVNSPGATRPTNAPVSRKARPPTSRYVQAPRPCERSPISLSRLRCGSSPPKTKKATIAAATSPRRIHRQLIGDLSQGLGAWTYLLVGGLAFLETGAFVGLVAPGEFTVLLGGAVASQGDVSLPLIIAVTWFCAFAGDSVSFMLGAHLGRGFLVRHGE